MTPGQTVVGAILCGGRSSRFGSDKALAALDDGTGLLVGHRVAAALRDGGADPVAAIGGTAGPQFGLPTVADLRPGDGPLAGLATALLWAKSGFVVVVPCDLVLLTGAHVAAVVDAATDASPGHAAVATVGGEPQVSLACWPAEGGRTVLGLLDEGRRSFRSALDHLPWVGVEVPAEALSDADTPEELRRLLGGSVE